jgi:hypothetical protein
VGGFHNVTNPFSSYRFFDTILFQYFTQNRTLAHHSLSHRTSERRYAVVLSLSLSYCARGLLRAHYTMTHEDSSSDPHGGGAFATLHGSGEAENEPFLSELDLAATRSRRSLSSDNSSTARRSHHARTEATVRTQLLYALPPRLSQWLASSSEADEGDVAEAATASRPGRRQSPPASHSDASASTLRVPVTLRVLPGNAPSRFAMVSHRRSSSSSLHEIRIDSDDDDDSSLPPLAPPSGTPPTHSHESTTGAAESPTVSSSDDDDLSTLDEFASLFRRCHQTLPFLALFVLYFVFQHIVGLAVFALGSVAIAGLDQRLRAQIALKELANRVHLVGILAICVIDAIVISSLDGELNPFKHLTLTLSATSAEGQPKTPHGALILDLLWIVLVNGASLDSQILRIGLFTLYYVLRRFHCPLHESRHQGRGRTSGGGRVIVWWRVAPSRQCQFPRSRQSNPRATRRPTPQTRPVQRHVLSPKGKKNTALGWFCDDLDSD